MPVELEHRAWWAIKQLNMDPKLSGELRLQQLCELEEFRFGAYDSARLYKERTKKYHDKRILNRELTVGDKVLLFNSRLRLFPGKLKSRWSGPYVVTEVSPFGYVELKCEEDGTIFKVNAQRVKIYLGDPSEVGVIEVLYTDPACPNDQ